MKNAEARKFLTLSTTPLSLIVCLCLCGASYSERPALGAETKSAKVTTGSENAGGAANNELMQKAGSKAKQPSENTKKVQAKTTAAAVNQIPGVRVAPNELEPPQLPPIKGFHPIKRLLRPVEELGSMSVQIEQQLMKMEGPVAALHPPMISLEKHMTNVNGTMEHMQGQVDGVTSQMSGVREDLNSMRKDVAELKEPILIIQKPLVGVAQPLEKLQTRLRWVLWAIIAATLGITFGTPVAAMYIYKHKEKLFKHAPETPPAPTIKATAAKS